jgi:imidazolonepropionase-like amidohydrolase
LNRIFIFLVFFPYSGISLTSFAQDSALHPRSGAGSKAILAFSNLREFNAIASPPANNMIAITNVTLIDGLGKEPVTDAVVLISGNKIEAVGAAADVKIPSEAKVVDAAGHSVLPGLVDSHFHIGSGETMYKIPSLFLSHGVTTARDPGRPIEDYNPIRSSNPHVPRLFLTGPHFDQNPPAWPKNATVIESPAHAAAAVRKYVDQGASGIKVYFRLSLDSIRTTCKTAHALGIPVTAHLELIDADVAIEAGLNGIEHVTSFGTALADHESAEAFRGAVSLDNDARQDGRYRLWAEINFDDNDRVKPLVDLIIAKGVFVSPTLATFERRAGGKKTPEFQVRGFKQMMRFVGLCHSKGATIVTGSHTWSRHVELGWAFQREMELLVESGLSPLEVISASTINNARFLGCAERLGTLEAGKLADLILAKGRPDQDIRAMYDISAVMLNGLWIKDKNKKQ